VTQILIEALIFDFDGLILETEAAIFETWQDLYRTYGAELTFEEWSQTIGTTHSPFNPVRDLESKADRPIDWDIAEKARQALEVARVERQPVMPGVIDYLEEARRLQLRIGLASSSSHAWVDGHLHRLGLTHYFETVKCADDVMLTKPDPALYLAAADALGVHPQAALALEDSPMGAEAARRAGMFCVAVPNELTRRMLFGDVDLFLESLAHISLAELLEIIPARNGKNVKAS
jgi:HAD superfamily hydrolase (TIGR01509 family)